MIYLNQKREIPFFGEPIHYKKQNTEIKYSRGKFFIEFIFIHDSKFYVTVTYKTNHTESISKIYSMKIFA